MGEVALGNLSRADQQYVLDRCRPAVRRPDRARCGGGLDVGSGHSGAGLGAHRRTLECRRRHRNCLPSMGRFLLGTVLFRRSGTMDGAAASGLASVGCHPLGRLYLGVRVAGAGTACFHSGNRSSRCSSPIGSVFWSIFPRHPCIRSTPGCVVRRSKGPPSKDERFSEYGWQELSRGSLPWRRCSCSRSKIASFRGWGGSR